MIEDVLKELRSAFQTNLAAAFNVEDAAYAAADVTDFGVALVLNNVETYRFEEAEELRVQEAPALFLLPRNMAESPLLHNQGFMAHTIELVFVERDTDPEKLARRVFRSLEAIRRVLTGNVEDVGTAENPTFMVDIVDLNYSPIFPLQPGGLWKTATLIIRCHEIEDRPA